MVDLPTPPKPRGRYRPVIVHRGVAYVSGQVSRDENEVTLTGIAAGEADIPAAQEAARRSMLRCLSVLSDAIGGLDAVEQVLMVRGFIRSAPDFIHHPKVMDAASDVLIDALGETRGQHARAAVGVASLPSGGMLEIELSVALRA
ncbi:RidA family protein [Aquabacter cavernae]|uniref:RidA family protein n=1 Tax=Aquabacter cavernae TaxID=2496029 RepID=UPI000F8D82E0|nr:RidA family protein [Aquabacter cavernae]